MAPRLEEAFRQTLLAPEPVPLEGMDERAWKVYRRQVRKSLMSGVRLAIPLTIALLPEEALDGLLEAWLAQAPPTSRLYWQLPMEFAAWLSQQPALPHPALAELVHWETIEVDILNAPDPDPSLTLEPEPAPEARVVLDPSARLCIYQHPVYRMKRDEPWPEPLPAPVFVVAFRVEERLRWRTITTPVAQLLATAAEHDVSLGHGLAMLAQAHGDGFDAEAVLAELRVLVDRGALRGFSRP